jgi:hypothetical protein
MDRSEALASTSHLFKAAQAGSPKLPDDNTAPDPSGMQKRKKIMPLRKAQSID